MKRKISYILPLLCSVLTVIAVTSCRKAPINGKLNGQWQYPSRTYRVCYKHAERPFHGTDARRIYDKKVRY